MEASKNARLLSPTGKEYSMAEMAGWARRRLAVCQAHGERRPRKNMCPLSYWHGIFQCVSGRYDEDGNINNKVPPSNIGQEYSEVEMAS